MAREPRQPVPVRDLEIAQRIAGAARSGGRTEREPMLEQLLAFFGETEPSAAARTRVASALRLAGVGAAPSVHEAHPGERVKLRLPSGAGHGRLSAVVAAGVVLVGAAAAVAAVSSGGSGDNAASAPASATTVTTSPAPATHEITVVTGAPPKAKKAPAKKQRRPRPGPRAKGGRKAKPAAPKRVVVRLVPGPQASYLCVDRGPGTPTTETTLASPLTFQGRRVRINVGLASVRVTVNGRPFALAGSPSGYDIAVGRRAYLPQGRRPCA